MVLAAAAAPYDGAGVLAFLAARAIPGVEAVEGGTYRRALSLAGGPAVVAVTPHGEGVDVELVALADPTDEPAALAACRRLFGLDIGGAAADAVLGADPMLGPLVARWPGLRLPGAADGFEIAVRAVLGQQITVAAARGLAGRIVAAAGAPLPQSHGAITHLFPTPERLAAVDDAVLTMPRTRAAALHALAASGLPVEDPADADALRRLHGIGPWTVGYVALRLGDPDVFLGGDVVVRASLRALGATAADAERWRPWRSLAVLHLWRAAVTRAAASRAPRAGCARSASGRGR